ncbi:hypothetical protein CC78DRAFT_538439, partial [Lojkania enalia]
MARRSGGPSAKPMPRRCVATPNMNKRQCPQGWSAPKGAASKPKFSLADEARYLSTHRSRAFDPDRKLRLLKIDFVSAGRLEGTIKEHQGDHDGHDHLAEDKQEDEDPPIATAAESPTTVQTMAKIAIRSPSPSPSASSEEVVFKGRGVTVSNSSMPSKESPASARQVSSREVSSEPAEPQRVVPRANNSPKQPTSLTPSPPLPASISINLRPSPGTANAPTILSQSTKPDSDAHGNIIQEGLEKCLGGKLNWDVNSTPWVGRRKPGIGWLPVRDRPGMGAFIHGDVNPANAAMDDYMQNIEDFIGKEGYDTNAPNVLAHRNPGRGATEERIPHAYNDETKAISRKSSSDAFEAIGDEGEWDSDAIRDNFGDASSQSDIELEIERIVAKRNRKNGAQYLVVYEDNPIDDAVWFSATFLKKPADMKLVNEFEARVRIRQQQSCSSTNSDIETGDEDEDDEDTGDETEDEPELDDERLARTLQKQEDLGLGSDRVMLYGGDEFFDGPVKTPRLGLAGIDRPSKRRQQRYGRRSISDFPSASTLADVLDMDPYNGFDIMDTERPSLRPTKGGRRSQLVPELSDEDLKEQLKSIWEADHAKKRIKKAEREELRKQGLLGRKGKSPNLSVKYRDGYSMDQVIEEIREFMISDTQTCSLPPMDAHRRAVVHQFVHQLGLTSRSRGDGQNRFTVLSKTLRTMTFSNETFDSIIDQRRFRARLQGSTRGPTQRSDRPKKAVVSYKEGDVVGASAPELGPENRGRAILEKMGWMKGTALGALDNKGILQPIAHTVKTSKAGL